MLAFLIGAFCVWPNNSANAQTGDSWADLRYMRGEGAPVIAKELYTISRAWVWCRKRQEQIDRGEECQKIGPREPLTNIELFEPERLPFLNELVAQIGPDGSARPQTLALLDSGGLTDEDLDRAIADQSLVWHTSSDWANILQVRINEEFLFFVAFYFEHQGAQNVAVDGALIPYPGVTMPEPRGYTPPDSGPLTAADFFLADGEYAKCGQQALLDAGFDPKGVDGAPGNGARAALENWSQANRLPLPAFTRENAAQICHVLTAKPTFPNKQRLNAEVVVWPLWSGSVYYNDNKADTSLVVEGTDLLQVSAFNFRGGLRFGDQQNGDMPLPWTPSGVVILDGHDGGDGRSGGGGAPTPMAQDMLRLIDDPLPDTGIASLQQMLASYRGSYPALRRALGATDAGIDMPDTPVWDIRWTVVDRLGDNDVVAADILLNAPQEDRRAILFMVYDADGNDDQLLYAVMPIAKPQPQNAFPEISGDTYTSGLFDADCDPDTPATTSLAIATHDGFEGHPVRLCIPNGPQIAIMGWTKTNAEGTSLTAALTFIDGSPLPVNASAYDEATGSNTYDIELGIDGVPTRCRIVKPAGGIAMSGESICTQ